MQIVKGFLEQEEPTFMKYEDDQHFRDYNDSSFGGAYTYFFFLKKIQLNHEASQCFYNKDKIILYKDIYTRIRAPLSFEESWRGTVHNRIERYSIDGELWLIEVIQDTGPRTKLVEDVINKIVYLITEKKNENGWREWDWDNIRAKKYEKREDAIYMNDGWPKLTDIC